MRVGLYDVDSKLPNLALMRLSAYHKNAGADFKTVSWADYQPKPAGLCGGYRAARAEIENKAGDSGKS